MVDFYVKDLSLKHTHRNGHLIFIQKKCRRQIFRHAFMRNARIIRVGFNYLSQVYGQVDFGIFQASRHWRRLPPVACAVNGFRCRVISLLIGRVAMIANLKDLIHDINNQCILS